MKKYELTEQTINLPGTTLYRIRALVDFGNVEAGDFGGYIASEKNLSHTGKCWVGGEAWAYGNSEVCENAVVCENAKVCGETKICGESVVCGNAKVEGYAVIKDNAWVSGRAEVFYRSRIEGNAHVCGDAVITGKAQITGNSTIDGYVHVLEEACIENGRFIDGERISGFAKINGNTDVFYVSLYIKDNQHLTFYRNKNSGISINAGFYEGEIENFRKVIEEKYSVEKKDAWFSVLDFAQTFFKKNTGPYIAPEHVRL